MLWLSNHVPEPLEMRILDWLYPDDMLVTFITEIRADTAKEAACILAEFDLADSAVMGEGKWIVLVRADIGPPHWQTFQVNMEMQPVFSARES